MSTPTSTSPWWKTGLGYQIWPASFLDSNGDGIGDLYGVLASLDHIASLGTSFIWFSPVYDSPHADAGYDVRSYESIHAPFGTLAAMDALIAAAHARGMRVVMDLVANHTSDQHAWFQASAASRDAVNPFAEFYLWRDPKFDLEGNRRPPNNWRAAFGGSVWTWSETRQQYYLGLCQPAQPDLNWHSPRVRAAVYRSAVAFWLRRGVDGFRVDVVNFYWKDPTFPDSREQIPGADLQPMEARYVINNGAVRAWLHELRGRIARDYPDRYVPLIGELPGVDRDGVLGYIEGERPALDMVLDMDLVMAGNPFTAPLHERGPADWPSVKRAITKTQGLLPDGGWPTAFLENHDHPRSVSVFAPGATTKDDREKAAKMLALLVGALSGTLFIYQGQELGMTNVPESWQRADFRDVATLRYFGAMDAEYPGDETMRDRAVAAARAHSRDNARTPVQWSAEAHAGFTSSSTEPWIRVQSNFAEINAAEQDERADSPLAFWRRVVALRKGEHADLFVRGVFEGWDWESEKTVAFVKWEANGGAGRRLLVVVVNVTGEEVDVPELPEGVEGTDLSVLIGNYGEDMVGVRLSKLPPLRPWEGRIYLHSKHN